MSFLSGFHTGAKYFFCMCLGWGRTQKQNQYRTVLNVSSGKIIIEMRFFFSWKNIFGCQSCKVPTLPFGTDELR